MAYNLKEVVANKPSRFTSGHRMCAGCGAPVVGRMVLRALHEDDHAVICSATGCMEVSTFKKKRINSRRRGYKIHSIWRRRRIL